MGVPLVIILILMGFSNHKPTILGILILGHLQNGWILSKENGEENGFSCSILTSPLVSLS